MINETEFHRVADAVLQKIAGALEKADESGLLDVELDGSILNVELQDRRQLLVSKHAPSRQLWLSSPVSGGLHFSYFSPSNEGGNFVSLPPLPLAGEGRGESAPHSGAGRESVRPLTRFPKLASELRKPPSPVNGRGENQDVHEKRLNVSPPCSMGEGEWRLSDGRRLEEVLARELRQLAGIEMVC